MPTTPALITAAQHGDQAALAELYRCHQPTVHRYITHHLTSPDLADDLTQDVFLRALRGLSNYRWTGRPIEAWLITIARNLITDHHKASSTRHELLAPELPDTAAIPSAEQQALAQLDAQPVRAALGALTAPHREALVLQHWGGMTDRQIAEHTGRTVGGVKSAKHRATVALRAALVA